MKKLLFLLLPVFCYSQFNPISSSTLWSWQGYRGKTLVGSEVQTWTDQANGYVLTARDSDNRPDNASTYLTFAADQMQIAAPATEGDFGTGDFTVSARVSLTDASALQGIIGKYLNSSNSWRLYISGNDIYFFSEIGNVASTYYSTAVGVSLANDTYYTITAVSDRDGSGVIYLDGEAKATTTNAMTAANITINTLLRCGEVLDDTQSLNGNLVWVQADNEVKDATWAANFHTYVSNPANLVEATTAISKSGFNSINSLNHIGN